MRDQVLFGVVPWVAACSFVLAAAVRYVQSRRGGEAADVTAGRMDATANASAWWWYSIAVVCLGHVLAVAFPTALLLWDRDAVRLIALEAAGLVAAVVAFGALIASAMRRPWWSDRRDGPSPVDVMAATLILLEIVTGIATALRYRWASSWSAVTLAPYLRSLAGLTPSTALVARMPLVVKLHVFCAFVILGVLPLTKLARTLVLRLHVMTRISVAPVAAVWQPRDGGDVPS